MQEQIVPFTGRNMNQDRLIIQEALRNACTMESSGLIGLLASVLNDCIAGMVLNGGL